MSYIKNKNGYIIANGEYDAIMCDGVSLDRFHIGKVKTEISSKMLGVPINEGFVLYVPAGVKTVLAYPTPIQTAKDLSKALKSSLYNELKAKFTEEELLNEIRDKAAGGIPINELLIKIKKQFTTSKSLSKREPVEYHYTEGIYEDGMPWSAVYANINLNAGNWNFTSVSLTKTDNKTHALHTQPLAEIITNYEKKYNKKILIGWNGGYILNGELVGKLGIGSNFIGSPLGLIIQNKKILSLPLFNKPALFILKDGSFKIKRVNIFQGFIIENKQQPLKFIPKHYNKHKQGQLCYYDLLYDKKIITSDGNTIIRLYGTRIVEIINTKKGQDVTLLPIGVHLSIPPEKVPADWVKNKDLDIKLNLNFKDFDIASVLHAVEAGPVLMQNHKVAVNMEIGGWKHINSINTQAARLDYTDMRGPKIAAGIDKQGNLIILCVNGRIRESVGATHHDMANILKKIGAKEAMGFDPGGSSTLIVNSKPINISPYNSMYEYDYYSLPPEPRKISNAILGWLE